MSSGRPPGLLNVQANDADSPSQAIEKLGQTFRVDATDLRAESFTAIAKAIKSQNTAPLLRKHLLPLIDQAVAEDKFEAARRLQQVAVLLAPGRRTMPRFKAVNRRARSSERAERYFVKDVKPAIEALTENPDNPHANSVVGKYRCFTQGN